MDEALFADIVRRLCHDVDNGEVMIEACYLKKGEQYYTKIVIDIELHIDRSIRYSYTVDGEEKVHEMILKP